MLVGLPSALANGVFAMNPEQAMFYLPMVINILEGKNVPVSHNQWDIAYPKTKNLSTGAEQLLMVGESNSAKYVGFDNTPKNSVLVMPINGAIMKQDNCGTLGTRSLAQIIADASASDNIAGVLLDIDSGGGELFGTADLSDAIANTDKPVIAYIGDGICASAAYFIACKADKILMGQPTSMVGSIGVYTTLIDPTGAAEKEGYKIRTIYSPSSPNKNQEYREAFNSENPSDVAMEKRLAFMDDVFMKNVKEHRPDITDLALEGGMFFTQDAISNGLADGTATMKEALEQVFALSPKHEILK